MHSGFRGVHLGLSTLKLAEGIITYEVAFVSEDGVKHASMVHRIPAEADPNLKQKVDELADMLLRRAASIHFSSPAGTTSGGLETQGENHGGIAEALADPTGSSDEPGGSQG